MTNTEARGSGAEAAAASPQLGIGADLGATLPVKALVRLRANDALVRYQGEMSRRFPHPSPDLAPRGHPWSAMAHGRGRGRRGRRGRRGAIAVARRLPLPLLVVGGAVALGGTMLVVSMVVAIILTVLPFIIVGSGIVLIVRHRLRLAARQRRRARTVAAPPLTVTVRPTRPEVAWQRARSRFAGVRAEYASYECEPMNVLRLPALADVSVPSTGRFVEAFAQAQALETDALPPPGHAAEFTASVDRAERAWRAACDAAERIRLSGLSAAERSTVERAIKLLTVARDSDSDAERLAAYSLARTELAKLEKAGVLHLPRTAQAALDAAARGQLPA